MIHSEKVPIWDERMAKSFKGLLKKHGFSYSEFAKFAGISRTTVYRWAQEDRCPYFYEYVLDKLEIKK